MHEVFYHNSERLAEKEWAKLQAVYTECISSQYSEIENMNRIEEYDFFISHASEDKDSFVRPLVYALKTLGLRVWYDEFTLEIGDSLRRSIDHGLGSSKYGIVVLSKSFFSKQWTQYELDALVNRSMNGNKIILPIWHNVKHQEVSCYSHSLADKVAYLTSALSIEQMAQELLKLLQRNN
jgi:TIR domain